MGEYISYYARENEVTEPTTIKMKFEPEIQGITSGNCEIHVLPSPLLLKTTQSVISYGDTVQIDVRKKTSPTDTIGVPIPLIKSFFMCKNIGGHLGRQLVRDVII
jgi:hypothetical protein